MKIEVGCEPARDWLETQPDAQTACANPDWLLWWREHCEVADRAARVARAACAASADARAALSAARAACAASANARAALSAATEAYYAALIADAEADAACATHAAAEDAQCAMIRAAIQTVPQKEKTT